MNISTVGSNLWGDTASLPSPRQGRGAGGDPRASPAPPSQTPSIPRGLGEAHRAGDPPPGAGNRGPHNFPHWPWLRNTPMGWRGGCPSHSPRWGQQHRAPTTRLPQPLLCPWRGQPKTGSIPLLGEVVWDGAAPSCTPQPVHKQVSREGPEASLQPLPPHCLRAGPWDGTGTACPFSTASGLGGTTFLQTSPHPDGAGASGGSQGFGDTQVSPAPSCLHPAPASHAPTTPLHPGDGRKIHRIFTS